MMKATINGITVEGTPEEIFDLMCRMGDAGSKRNSKHLIGNTDWLQKEIEDAQKRQGLSWIPRAVLQCK
jgi:hypothetical protein